MTATVVLPDLDETPVLRYVRPLWHPVAAVCEFGCDAPAYEVGYDCPSCSTPQTAVLCGDHLKALERRLSGVTRIGGNP